MNGITFNNKHSYDDYDLFIINKSIQSAAKKKIKIDVPFMNGSYDFSSFGSNEVIYSQREIVIKFGIPANSRKSLYVKYSKVLAWLNDTGQQKLIFDEIKDYYFMAEVESIPTFEEIIMFGKLEVKFIAEPFKTSVDFVGADIWDTFNFEEDITQTNNFNIVNTATISVYNSGRLITPIINCNAPMVIIIGGVTYNLTIGDNKLYGLKLKNGYNTIIINGIGNIKFKFKKVSL